MSIANAMIDALPRILRLVVPGPSTSTNMLWRTTSTGRVYKNPAAVEYQKRVHSIAFAEVVRQNWKHRDSLVQVSIWSCNLRHDLDNICKSVLDAIQGLVYSNDKQVQRLLVERVKDRSGPRLEIEVSPWM